MPTSGSERGLNMVKARLGAEYYIVQQGLRRQEASKLIGCNGEVGGHNCAALLTKSGIDPRKLYDRADSAAFEASTHLANICENCPALSVGLTTLARMNGPIDTLPPGAQDRLAA